jgi:DeoR/GlpR family transcriptional regulator of sugar metabolism
MLRRHRLGRLCEEACDQGGLLTQEDLAQILSCDSRTVRRDINPSSRIGEFAGARSPDFAICA